MDTPTKPVNNRVAADLQAWDNLEKHFSQKYGPNVWNDRETQKVKAGIHQQILSKYAGQSKNERERIELKMLRAHHRANIRRLYPNPWVRLVRNSTKLTGNIALTGIKGVFQLLKFLVNPTLGNRSQSPTAAPIGPVKEHYDNNKAAQTYQQGKTKAQGNRKGNSQTSKQQQQQKGSQKKSTGQKQGAAAQKGQTATKQQPAAQKNGTKQQPAAKNGQTTGKQQPAAKNGQATGKQQPAAQKQNQQGQRPTAKIHNLNPRQMSQPVSQGRGMHR